VGLLQALLLVRLSAEYSLRRTTLRDRTIIPGLVITEAIMVVMPCVIVCSGSDHMTLLAALILGTMDIATPVLEQHLEKTADGMSASGP
jgi:hypothetical protein